MLRYIAVIILFGLTIPLTGHTDRLIKDLITVFGDGSGSDVVLEANVGDGANNPKLKYDNTENVWQFTNDGIDFLEFGSGSGGGSAGISLIEDRSFEKGVAGSGYSADLTSEETVVLLSPTNTKSLKVVATDTPLAGKFSTYTYNASINSEWHEGMPITVKGWIKWPSTNASIGSVTVSDTIDELQSITLESKDEWQEFKVKTNVGATSTIRTVIKFSLEDGQIGDLFYLDMLDVIAGHEGDSPYKVSDIGEWQDYTPTTQGLGTPSFQLAQWRKVGDTIEIQGRFTAGTPTASELQLGLPDGLVLSSEYTQTQYVGTVHRSVATTDHFILLATGGDSFLNVGVRTNSVAGTSTPQNGNFIVGSSEAGVHFSATAKIQGWSSSTSTVVTQTQEETVKTANKFGAKVNASDVVDEDVHDWINGDCTNALAGRATCTYNSGIFTQTPNCEVTPVENVTEAYIVTESATAITVITRTSNGTNTDGSFNLECKKRKSDYRKSLHVSGTLKETSIVKDRDQYSTIEMKWGKWNGEQLYRRCFTIDSDKTTTNTLLYTIDANLVPRNVPRYYNVPSSYALLSASYGTDSFLINYNPSTGEVKSYVTGNYIVKAGTSFCMDYTK